MMCSSCGGLFDRGIHHHAMGDLTLVYVYDVKEARNTLGYDPHATRFAQWEVDGFPPRVWEAPWEVFILSTDERR